MQEIRLGIAGLGTVAQGVLHIIRENGRLIAERTGMQITVSRVASRTPKPEVDLGGAQFSTQLDDLVGAEDVDVVLELIGGEDVALGLMESALLADKPVVTANKAVIACSGNQLLASNDPVPVRFEAAVAGAIPVIQAVQDGLVANRIGALVGIINGTCNYILTAMEAEGADFDDALKQAQEKGFAEADPTFDIEGIDAAHKLTILAGLGFDTAFNFDEVYVEGIRRVTRADIEYARELGYTIKHVGIARQTAEGIEARVHPALLPEQHLLANVNDVANAVVVQSDAAGQTLFSGPGAGSLATASAVLADVVAVARDMNRNAGQRDQGSTLTPVRPKPGVRYKPIDEVQCAHYLRIPSRDEPGVFAQVANALSQHGISIEAAIQKQPAAQQDVVSIVILTQVVRESEVKAAMAEVSALPEVAGEITRIRLESLD